jgi:flavin-dependent thymidylate synthase
MKVSLLHTNGLEFSDNAIGMCYDKGCYTDSDKRDKRIKKVALKFKHASTIEFTNFIFEIEASTKVLLEMTRHRLANYACKSSRYTLNKGEIVFESTGDADVDKDLDAWKTIIESYVATGTSNEVTSLMLPQAYQYRWQVQFNARSLMNFFVLRRASSAHPHIRDVANAMFDCIPEEMKYLFEDSDDE